MLAALLVRAGAVRSSVLRLARQHHPHSADAITLLRPAGIPRALSAYCTYHCEDHPRNASRAGSCRSSLPFVAAAAAAVGGGGAMTFCMAGGGRDQAEVEEFDRARINGDIEDVAAAQHWADSNGKVASRATVTGMLRQLRNRASWRSKKIPLCDLTEDDYEKV